MDRGVPLDNAVAPDTPHWVASSRSKASTWGPSGAAQLLENASATRSRSAWRTSGSERYTRLMTEAASRAHPPPWCRGARP